MPAQAAPEKTTVVCRDLEAAVEPHAVCQVLHSLKVGGAEVLAAQLARKLQGRYRFVFACLDEPGTLGEELSKEGFRVEVLGRRPGVDWRCMWRLARLLRRENVKLVHAHQYTPFFYAFSARLLGRRRPLLFTEHGRHFPDYPRRKRMILNRLLLRRRDRVVGVGEAVRQALITNEGIPAERVSVIYNGVDLEGTKPRWADRQRIRREMGVAADNFVVIQVARLDYLKDHATAIRAIKHVAALRPDARLVLVGEGPERAKLEEHVGRLNLADHVRFLGLRKDVPQLLTGADLFLLTSISEGIPLTVIEAMNAGVPVVSTRVGGVPEIIEDGENGLLAPAGDDHGLADHIIRLASDSGLRTSLGRSGRERARAVFSQEKMHAGYVRLYQEMLHG